MILVSYRSQKCFRKASGDLAVAYRERNSIEGPCSDLLHKFEDVRNINTTPSRRQSVVWKRRWSFLCIAFVLEST